MLLTIRHDTRYEYDQPVDYALQKLRLKPLDSVMQTVDDWQVEVDGGQIEASYRDHYGNHVDLVSAHRGAEGLTITARGTVTTLNTSGVLGHVYGCAPLWHFAEPTPVTQAGRKITALAEALGASETPLVGLHALSAAILEAVPYKTGETNAQTSAEAAAEIGTGVCQDHANIFISAARLAGIPARYVSGYLMMTDTIDQDASHAWAEAYLPDIGWVGFDVSNGYSPDERYVRLAIGRDSADAAPMTGLRLGPARETMMVSVQVQQAQSQSQAQ